MEIFKYANKVRLRSYAQGKYLAADADSTGVYQIRNRNHESAIWEVRQFRDHKSVVRFRSSYGGYLTGSDSRFLLGWKGKQVVQTNPTKADDLCEWQPVEDGEHGTLIKLRTRDGTYLRANGGAPPWRNSVTHNESQDDENVLWEVELVQEKDYSEAL